MSINVTINGKPINLNTKGRMVACAQDSEFNQRRKIRLQQVRQQSKEIAAEVRNRVKQERTKQLSNIEHQTEKDLRKFQDRKLNTLRKQYEDCNREIGAAHKNAAMEKDPSEVLNEISKKNDKTAHERLKVAVENKTKDELQRKNKLELLEKQRKYSKDIEKTRANLVATINKQHSPTKLTRSNKKRKKKTDANLSDTFNSDIENISSPSRRSRSPIKPKKSSPNKRIKTPERKSHQKQQTQQKSQQPENPKPKKIIFDHEIHSIRDENFMPQPKETKSKIDIKSKSAENQEKHLNSDIEIPRKEKSPVDIELPQKENSCPVCFDVKSTQTEKPEKHLKIDEKSPRKEKSKIGSEYPQKEVQCFVCWEKSKSRQFHEEKSEKSCPKRVISSGKGDFIYEDETSPCLSPLPHDRAILYPTSPPTPTKCASHFSSASSLTKEISKDEIKKLIEDHRPIHSCRSMNYYKTTKISDRIRQRSEQLSQDIDIDSINIIPEHKRKNMNLRDAKKLEMKNIPIVDIPSVNEKLKESSNLPYVPKTTLKSKATLTNVSQQQTTKAKYYDHSKHYSKTYVPPASVQKLDKDCVEVDTSIESAENADFFKKMCSQEERAKIRGDKALKRAQIQNDYKQLMEELPVLQRQERLAAMRNHNPEFHMTDERLHELERRRQSRIENIFEKYYHKSKSLETPIITIRPVQKPAPDEEMKLPFTALDVSEELQPFNIGQWKSENPSHASKSLRQFESAGTWKTGSSSGKRFQFVDLKPELSSEIPSQKATVDEDSRQKCLAELLQRLNKQRELLLQEVQNLPPSSNLQKILHDENLHITDDSSNTGKPKFVSASTSPIASEPKKTKNVKKRQGSATSSDSPQEKHKKRQKPKEKKPPKVLKNDEGTQTSPNIQKKLSPVKEKHAPVKEVPQEDKHAIEDDKLCEIIIKMCDDSKVKICTQPIGSVDRKHEEIVRPPQKQINCDISSSTSYLSPPTLLPKPIEQNEKSRSDYKDILYGKPKQTNIDAFPKREHAKEERLDHIKKHSISKQKHVKPHTPTKIINPQLLNYIKKLLSMSRKSIDDLTVSSISDVSSPSPNVVESQHNNPFIQLQNVMNYYNLSFADIQTQLSKSSSSATKSDKNTTTQNTNAEMEQLDGGDSSPTSDDVDYSEILSKYQEVTKSCVDKISTLTLMIDKIRAEKENILSPISVDLNENTLTSYLELPPHKDHDSPVQEVNSLSSKNCTSTSGGSNKSCSLTQEEIDKYFLEISPPKKDRQQIDKTDGKSQGDSNVNEAFVPMLKGIPKYNNDIVNEINLNSKPRPPASLSQNVQRYNLNIDMTPHELSTIVELDTATTSKNISLEQRPKSPEEHIPIRDSDDIPSKSRESKETTSTSNSGFITISPEHPDTSPKKVTQRKSPRSKNTILQLSGLQLLSSPSENTENTSSSSPENFENILRTMGLGWAVSTLKKTQEALALSSSSSSDSSLRKHVSFNNTSLSDITLKDVLNREFLKKLSSSSTSDSPNLQDLQDLSEIGGVTQNKDRSTQRTSTPVQQSKSTDSKNNLFASVSDISSVRQHSDENMFLSIPDISLDTNRSLK